MTEGEIPRFGMLLATLAEVYQRTLSDVASEAYYQALSDCAIEDLEAAVGWILRYRTNGFMPVPGEWRAAAREAAETRRLRTPALPAPREPSAAERAEIATLLAGLTRRFSVPPAPADDGA